MGFEPTISALTVLRPLRAGPRPQVVNVPDRNRTCDLAVINRALLPAELRVQTGMQGLEP